MSVSDFQSGLDHKMQKNRELVEMYHSRIAGRDSLCLVAIDIQETNARTRSHYENKSPGEINVKALLDDFMRTSQVVETLTDIVVRGAIADQSDFKEQIAFLEEGLELDQLWKELCQQNEGQ